MQNVILGVGQQLYPWTRYADLFTLTATKEVLFTQLLRTLICYSTDDVHGCFVGEQTNDFSHCIKSKKDVS